MKGEGGSPLLIVPTCVHCCHGSEVYYCDCAYEVESSILNAVLFYILYNNNNSDKLDSLYLEIPTGLLLDSYWTPTGILVLDSSIPIP